MSSILLFSKTHIHLKYMKIAIIGPPGSGKTTFCWGLGFLLKKMGKKVELLPEMIKFEVYKGADFSKDGFDIRNTLSQRDIEDGVLRSKNDFDYVICEAPLCNGYFYSLYYKKEEETEFLKKIAKKYISTYDVILRMPLGNKDDYQQFGRNESYEQTVDLDNLISKEIQKLNYKGKVIKIDDRNDILGVISSLMEIKK